MKRHNDSDWMPYRGCLLVAEFVKMVSCLTISNCCIKQQSVIFVSMHRFRDGLSLSLSQNGSHFSSSCNHIASHTFSAILRITTSSLPNAHLNRYVFICHPLRMQCWVLGRHPSTVQPLTIPCILASSPY